MIDGQYSRPSSHENELGERHSATPFRTQDLSSRDDQIYDVPECSPLDKITPALKNSSHDESMSHESGDEIYAVEDYEKTLDMESRLGIPVSTLP